MAQSKALLLCALVVVQMALAFAAGPPTEAEVRKMKMRELKDFLKDRGESCKGCVEKSDFVKKVISVREKKIIDERADRQIPEEPFHKHWGKLALDTCVDNGLKEDQCKSLKSVTELLMDEYKRKYKRDLGVTEKQLYGITIRNPYKDAMLVNFKKVSNWMKKEDTKSSSKIRPKLTELLSPWLRDCATENPNEMYHIIKNKNKRDEL